ncbi:hypothetical protein GPECTOR_7g1112 [Gonium pectorale]|uniref:BRX domain-containing protein n=1 Tax=Gonium pectorale TaxID=33097 RepID=A0A150GTR0_GONPE|nr:hypothetical protein GPECTOR_7g1112 [Gonium pectorale]|eukprot:KXZ53219.1 hypothetical protein GPECTOR_7g1112 [Gonium pectorale]
MNLLPPTHEGGGVYVNGFPSGPKPYEEVLTFLRKGQIRRIPLACITKWQRGQETVVFKRQPMPKAVNRSFSIYYVDEKRNERTLDVICHTVYEFEMWFWGVQIIRHYPPSAWSAPTQLPQLPAQQYSQAVVPAAKREAPAQSLTDDRTPKPVPKSKPGLSSMVNTRNSGVATGMPLPARRDRRELGDLYVWGSLITYEHDEWFEPKAGHLLRSMQREERNPEIMLHWQQSREPVLVQNASSVDVVRVACAPRHAALITRKGELYTWGYGKDGNLGHGWCANQIGPRLVTRMSGKGVHTLACGEGSTAAISADMRLYMWGSNVAGQLGNGYTFPVVEPTPVVFPGLREDVPVLAVSCGPFHTAAITEGGMLFTWGNGLFGKLGHGTHASEYRPRRVMALEDKCVTGVSCGYWHTAAVAVSRAAAAIQ